MRNPTKEKRASFWVRLGQKNTELPITLDNLFQIALPVVRECSGETKVDELLEQWLSDVIEYGDFAKANVRLFRAIDKEAQ